MSGGPLQGIRVVECGGYLSAPTACYMLGDLGAEIIKIEDREKGDPSRGHIRCIWLLHDAAQWGKHPLRDCEPE